MATDGIAAFSGVAGVCAVDCVVGCDLMPMVGVLRDGGEKPIDGGHAVQPVHNKRERNSVPVI